eukprot:gene2226-2535_t
MRLSHQKAQTAFQQVFLEGCKLKTVSRSVWIRPKNSVWWDDIMEKTFSDEQWLQNFRMRRRTFDFLCKELNEYLQKQDTKFRKAITVRKRCGVAIWRLATNSDYRTIGHIFGISKASVCLIIDEFSNFMTNVMLPRYISTPHHGELAKVVEEMGFLQCAGAIDGSHIPIKAPAEYHADYYNRKGCYSIILQAVIDSSYKFIDIYVDWPGKFMMPVFLAIPLSLRKGRGNPCLLVHPQRIFMEDFDNHLLETTSASSGKSADQMTPFMMIGQRLVDRMCELY